jgi:hypothetical protein
MDSRTAPRLISATIILLGCALNNGVVPAPAPIAPVAVLPSAWAVDPAIVADTTAPTADSLYAIGVVRQYDREPPVIVPYVASPGADLREILDGRGAYRLDVLVTEDANVIAYAAGRANLLVAALPWSATYVLVPARARSEVTVPSPAERSALARDAVTTDARGAAEPFPWITDAGCAATAAVAAAEPRPVVAYAAGDATARQLAERIVSLAGANAAAPWIAAAFGGHPTGLKLRIAPLDADSIGMALAAGSVAAAVLPVARDPRTSCATAGNAHVTASAIPLVDTRAHVIVRRGSGAAFTIAANGSLHFFPRASK